LARPLVLIPHLFRLASAIKFRNDYSPPLVRHLDLSLRRWLGLLLPRYCGLLHTIAPAISPVAAPKFHAANFRAQPGSSSGNGPLWRLFCTLPVKHQIGRASLLLVQNIEAPCGRSKPLVAIKSDRSCAKLTQMNYPRTCSESSMKPTALLENHTAFLLERREIEMNYPV